MCNFFFSIALFSSSLVYSWNLDPDSLREKCYAEESLWMKDQIDRELEPFAESFVSRSMIEETLKAIFMAQKGDVSEMVQINIEDGMINWASPFALSERGLYRLDKTLEALQILQQMIHLPNISFLLSLADRYDRPYFFSYTQAPVMTISKERGFIRSILFPRAIWEEEVFDSIVQASRNISWDSREKVAFWRGSISSEYTYVHWDLEPRPRLMIYSLMHPTYVNAALLNNHYIESFYPAWKTWLEQEDCFKPFISKEEQLHYRYLIAIDGGATPASLSWQLFSGSTILKADSHAIEWYYDQLKPYVHYLPFNNTSLDLQEKIEWLRTHDDEARKMAQEAEQFAKEWLNDEQAFLYFYKLLESYSKIYQKCN